MSSFYIILACMLWAIDTLIRYPLIYGGMSSLDIVFFEHLFLCLILFFPFRKSLKFVFHPRNIFSFIVIGCFGSTMATLAFTKAFEMLNPSVVIILQKLQPLVAISLAAIVLKEKMSKRYFVLGSVCLMGAILIGYDDLYGYLTDPQFHLHSVFDEKRMTGYLYVAIAVVGWGASTVFGRKLALKGFDEPTIMLGRFIGGLLILLPFASTIHYQTLAVDNHLIKVLAMVVLSGLGGIYFYYKGLRKTPARLATLLELFFPLCAVIVNWIFLDQQLSPLQWIGGAILVLGSTLMQVNERK